MRAIRQHRGGKPYAPVYRYDGVLLGYMPMDELRKESLVFAQSKMSGFPYNRKKPPEVETVKVRLELCAQSPFVYAIYSEDYDILYNHDPFIPSEWFEGFMEGKGRSL